MTDEELLQKWREQVPYQLTKVLALPEGVLTINDPQIIEASWGPRRVSSRTRGTQVNAYPTEVTASKGLWISWLKQPRDYVSVVIAKKLAQARIDAALGLKSLDPEAPTVNPMSQITEEEVEDLLEERKELRAARLFEDADKIRDYLLKNGVSVADQKV